MLHRQAASRAASLDERAHLAVHRVEQLVVRVAQVDQNLTWPGITLRLFGNTCTMPTVPRPYGG